MGIEIEKFPKSLYSNDTAGDRVIHGHTCLKIFGQYMPCATAELSQELPIIHEIWTEPLWYAEYPLSVGHFFQYFLMELFTEFNNTLLMTGRAKMTPLAGEREQVLMMTVIAFDTGKSLVKVSAVQIFIYYIQHIRTPIPILFLVSSIPYTLQFFKMCFHTLVVLIFARASWCIHFSPGDTSSKHKWPSLKEQMFDFRLPYNTIIIKRRQQNLPIYDTIILNDMLKHDIKKNMIPAIHFFVNCPK